MVPLYLISGKLHGEVLCLFQTNVAVGVVEAEKGLRQ